MDKGYYGVQTDYVLIGYNNVAIHNKNGQGLLQNNVTSIDLPNSCRNPQ